MNTAKFMVAEKNGNRCLHETVVPGRDRKSAKTRWSLEVCAKGFARTSFVTEAEAAEKIAMLKKELPHFQFETCQAEDFTIEQVIEGSTYVFRK